MANRKHDLQETKGFFQFRGKVTGTDKDSFYKESTTKTKKAFKAVNFGIEIDKGKTLYIGLNGMEQDNVYFSHKKDDGKYETIKKSWAERKTFKADGYRLIGVNLGITKTVDKSGNEINDNRLFVPFDACQFIADNLVDDSSVFIKGSIEHSVYNDKHQTRFTPQQISLCKKAIDFDAEDYKALADFEQTICFKEIEKTSDGYTIHGYVIGYNDITEVEMYMKPDKANFAKTLKKLKPYTSVTLVGYVAVESNTEQVTQAVDDAWGDTESNSFTKVSAPTERKLYVTAGKSDSVDTSLYTEDSVMAAIAKLNSDKQADKDYGGSSDDDDWGSVGDSSDDDDFDDWG